MLGVPASACPEVDIVFVWADGSDERWRAKLQRHLSAQQVPGPQSAVGPQRWRDFDELRYSVRSVFINVSFLRRIYIVTDDQRPRWLCDSEVVRIIDHREIFPDPAVLPCFSTRGIEANVHRIPDLAEHFLLMNDDFFVTAPVQIGDFVDFARGGKLIYRVYPRLVLKDREREASDTWFSSLAASFMALERRFGRFHDPLRSNTLREIWRACTRGAYPFNEVSHQIQMYRRSECFEAEEIFRDEFRMNSSSRFRVHGTYNVHTLRAYCALHRGTALLTAAGDESLYLASASRLQRWQQAEKRLIADTALPRPKFLCLNDTTADASRSREWARFLQCLLPKLFPERSPVE